jgi:methylthioribose-1-phosphate isomerase
MEFPLLAWSARLHNDSFDVLDESVLPEEVSFVTVTNYVDAVDVIRSMKTRAFGQLLTVLYALVLTVRNASRNTLLDAVVQASEALKTSRPTFAFGKYTDLVIEQTAAALKQREVEPSDYVEKSIIGLLDRIKKMRLRRAELAASLLDDGDTILTHCNTSGELLLTARICRKQGKELSFFATETRPYFQGRLTAWEMSREGFEATLIPDNRTASLLSSATISKVVTGADRVALNGDIVNKTGTFQIAMLAKRYGVPFFSYVQEPGETASGKEVAIEFRPDDEVVVFQGKRRYPDCVNAFYPAFDVTPHQYISKLITFDKILRPAELPDGWSHVG